MAVAVPARLAAARNDRLFILSFIGCPPHRFCFSLSLYGVVLHYHVGSLSDAVIDIGAGVHAQLMLSEARPAPLGRRG